jgi:hypothetical protein
VNPIADLDPGLATLRATPLGLGQVMDPGFARQVLWQGPAAVRACLLRRLFSRFGSGRSRVGRLRRLRLEDLGEERDLTGVEALGTGAVKTSQEEVEARLSNL